MFACKAVREAYTLMKIDAGYLSAAEETAFRACGGAPERCVMVAESPVVRRLGAGGLRVSLILFPPLPDEAERPSEKMLQTLLAVARKEAGADLVVGMSPWGFKAEGFALQRLSEAFDVLLGSGAGAPFPLEVTDFAPGIVWSRSDRDGRYVIELTFYSLPDPHSAEPHSWTRDIDVTAREWPLSQHIPNDQAVFEALAR